MFRLFYCETCRLCHALLLGEGLFTAGKCMFFLFRFQACRAATRWQSGFSSATLGRRSSADLCGPPKYDMGSEVLMPKKSEVAKSPTDGVESGRRSSFTRSSSGPVAWFLGLDVVSLVQLNR